MQLDLRPSGKVIMQVKLYGSAPGTYVGNTCRWPVRSKLVIFLRLNKIKDFVHSYCNIVAKCFKCSCTKCSRFLLISNFHCRVYLHFLADITKCIKFLTIATRVILHGLLSWAHWMVSVVCTTNTTWPVSTHTMHLSDEVLCCSFSPPQ